MSPLLRRLLALRGPGAGRLWRALCAPLGALALALIVPAAAWAHGGPMIPPPPPVEDPPKPPVPFMPPPPPATPPPQPLTPPEKPSVAPLPTTPPRLPTTPPGSLPPPAPPSGGAPGESEAAPVSPRARPWLARRPAGATRGEDASAWQAWWALARGGLLPDRDEARRRSQDTPLTPLSNLGEPGSGALEGYDRQREALAQAAAVPVLKRLAAPTERSSEIRASALIALARLSAQPATVDLLLTALFEDRADGIVRESAALGLGLLRRTSPEQRATPSDVERARDALLYALDDERVPDRTRAFAAFGLGLLGDQPYDESGVESDVGLLPALWSRLARPHASRELPVALLTALGAQCPKVLPEGVPDGLRTIVLGRVALGRRWSDVERSHALTALARLAPAASASDVLRALARHREAPEVVRAGAIALGAHAAAWSADRRAEALPVVQRGIDEARDPFTRGLLRLALGRLLAADLKVEGGSSALAASGAPRLLLQEANTAVASERGFAVLALALGAQPLAAADGPPAWVQEARRLLLEGLARTSEDEGLRSAYAVALGLLGDGRARDPLLRVVSDRDQPVLVRGHGAVALGQLGAPGAEPVRALVLLLSERRQEALRAQAALGLSWLGSREALPLLLREAQDPGAPEHVLAQVAVALGRLGSVEATGVLVRVAGDAARGENARALAIVALGLVLDPEQRSSLLRLALDANYPARTAALHELLTIL